jgi:hypothetical protein
MKLATQLSTFAALLEGKADEATTRQALFGAQHEHGADAGRLAIYARFCRLHRVEALEGVYVNVRQLVVRRLGQDAWHALVEAFFLAHPMHHVELNENGAAFSDWLATRADLPPWLATVAEVEWWDWVTFVAPDEPPAATLRLSSTVEIRPLAWAIDPWLDAGAEGDPEHRANLLIFWRDRDLDSRRGELTSLELLVVKAVSEGVEVAPAGIDAEDFAATLADLTAAGIVLP